MKTLSTSLTIVFVLLCFASFACTNVIEKSDTPYLVKEFQMKDPGNLLVQTTGGNIHVSSHAENNVKVEMFLKEGNREIIPGDEAAKEVLENFDITIDKSSNTISAIAKKKDYKFRKFNNISISFHVWVPEHTSCNLQTSGGSISLHKVLGKQVVRTSGGSLKLTEITGDMDASTSGGSIRVYNYEGNLRASTSGGSITLFESQGDLLAQTSGGGIYLDKVSGKIEGRTSGGSIEANLLSVDEHVKLKTSGGSISVAMTKEKGLNLHLKGSRVNVKLDNFSGEAKKDKVVGSLNGGGTLVELATSGGNVNLDFQ